MPGLIGVVHRKSMVTQCNDFFMSCAEDPHNGSVRDVTHLQNIEVTMYEYENNRQSNRQVRENSYDADSEWKSFDFEPTIG